MVRGRGGAPNRMKYSISMCYLWGLLLCVWFSLTARVSQSGAVTIAASNSKSSSTSCWTAERNTFTFPFRSKVCETAVCVCVRTKFIAPRGATDNTQLTVFVFVFCFLFVCLFFVTSTQHTRSPPRKTAPGQSMGSTTLRGAPACITHEKST